MPMERAPHECYVFHAKDGYYIECCTGGYREFLGSKAEDWLEIKRRL